MNEREQLIQHIMDTMEDTCNTLPTEWLYYLLFNCQKLNKRLKRAYSICLEKAIAKIAEIKTEGADEE